MQMIFNPGGQQGPNKSEGLDDGAPTSPWANLLSVGLKILSAFLGGGAATGDGIDKVDNGSPMQVGGFSYDFVNTTTREGVIISFSITNMLVLIKHPVHNWH